MSRLRTYAWAIWTTGRAVTEYLAGRIGEYELRTRVGIARVAVGRDEVSIEDAKRD